MTLNINEIVDGILIPHSEISLERQEDKGKISLNISLSSLVNAKPQIAIIFELLKKLSFSNFAITIAGNPDTGNTSLGITFDEIILRKSKEQTLSFSGGSIILEIDRELDACKNGNEIFKEATIRSLDIKLSENLVNAWITNYKDILQQKNIKDLSVSFLDGSISVKGTVRKLTNIQFNTTIVPGISKRRLFLNIANVHIMNLLSIPSFVQNIVLDLIGDYIDSEFIEIRDKHILIDPAKLSQFKIMADIKTFESRQGYINLTICETEIMDCHNVENDGKNRISG